MAAKKDKWNEADRVSVPKSATKSTSALAPTRKIEVGSQIVGVFQKAKLATIQDTETHEDKEVMVYTFRDPKSGEIFAILGGRTGLDNAMDDMFIQNGGPDKTVGMMVAIERGENSERSGGRKGFIGNYEVYSWIPEKD